MICNLGLPFASADRCLWPTQDGLDGPMDDPWSSAGPDIACSPCHQWLFFGANLRKICREDGTKESLDLEILNSEANLALLSC